MCKYCVLVAIRTCVEVRGQPESVSSPSTIPGDWTQAVRCDGNCSYPLIQLADPKLRISFQ